MISNRSSSLQCYHICRFRKYLRHGHLEKVYENGLAHRLRKVQLTVEQQYPLKVYDEDGTVLGEYFADLFVESKLIARPPRDAGRVAGRSN